MLPRSFSSNDQTNSQSWQDLGHGAPTIMALATVCSRAIVNRPDCNLDDLSDEAKAILAVAADRGTMDIRASREPFDSSKDFSLSASGFEIAKQLKRADYEAILKFAVEIEH